VAIGRLNLRLQRLVDILYAKAIKEWEYAVGLMEIVMH
jgi:hypothetical protein